MTATQLVFLLTGAITLGAALMVVLSPRLVHAALWLILSLAGTAVLFVLLEAGFLAVVQVAIYIDAIAILIIIVIMLTRRVMIRGETQLTRNWWLGALAALILFGGLLILLNQLPIMTMNTPPPIGDAEHLLEDLGRSLVDVNRFILPFEVASILLLAALVGSIIIAWPLTTPTDGEDDR
jgi:NADH-quinone oxidoreductase subunit J